MIFYSNNNEKQRILNTRRNITLTEKIAKTRFRIHLVKMTALLRFQIRSKTRKRLSRALKRAQRLFIHIDFKFKLGKRVIPTLRKIGV